MLQLARKFSKLSTSPLSFFGLPKTFPAPSIHTAAALQFQLTGTNYGNVAKKKKKQDPSESNSYFVGSLSTSSILQVR